MMTRYVDFVSDEPLDSIRANECEYRLHELSTQRFRRLWNEIEVLRAELAGKQNAPMDIPIYKTSLDPNPTKGIGTIGIADEKDYLDLIRLSPPQP